MVLVTLLCLLTAQNPAAPDRLTPANFEQIKEYVSLRENDLNFQKIDWKTTLYDAVAEAQKVDKPILMWLYFGDPRGGC